MKSEIAREAAEKVREHFGKPFIYKSLNDPVLEMIEAAIEKARDLPDERWLAQQLHASNELCAALQEDTERLRAEKVEAIRDRSSALMRLKELSKQIAAMKGEE